MTHDPPTIAELQAAMAKMPKPRWVYPRSFVGFHPMQVIYRMPDNLRVADTTEPTRPAEYPTMTLEPVLFVKGHGSKCRECVVWQYNGPVTQELPQ